MIDYPRGLTYLSLFWEPFTAVDTFIARPWHTCYLTVLLAIFTCISANEISRVYPPPLAAAAERHCRLTSFLVPLRIGGWVGLGGWLRYRGEVVCQQKTVAHPSTNRAGRRVTSFIDRYQYTHYPLMPWFHVQLHATRCSNCRLSNVLRAKIACNNCTWKHGIGHTVTRNATPPTRV